MEQSHCFHCYRNNASLDNKTICRANLTHFFHHHLSFFFSKKFDDMIDQLLVVYNQYLEEYYTEMKRYRKIRYFIRELK